MPRIDPELWVLVHGGFRACAPLLHQPVETPPGVRDLIRERYREAARRNFGEQVTVKNDAAISATGYEDGEYVEVWLRVETEGAGGAAESDYRSAAQGMDREDILEIADSAQVEIIYGEGGEPSAALVQCWVWVYADELETHDG